jgi:hypothetical protein
LPVALLLAGIALPAAAAEPAEIGAFRDSLAAWRRFDEPVRTEKARAFLEPIGVERFRDLCRACGKNESEDMQVQSFLRAKLHYQPFSPLELGSMIDDVSVGALCHKELVKHVREHKQEYDEADAEVLGAAMLRLADQAGYPEGIRRQLEMAGAALAQDDAVLARMKTYIGSSDDAVVAHGAKMLTVSRHPQAEGLLLDLLTRRTRDKRPLPANTLIDCGRAFKAKAFEPLLLSLSMIADPEERYGALQAIAYTEDPRALRVVLRAYEDSAAGIRDWTSRDTGKEERPKYFWLWHCTRVLEPAIRSALTGTSVERRRQGIELLDRASRFGILEQYPAMLAALEAAVAAEPSLSERVTAIRGRLDHWERVQAERGK